MKNFLLISLLLFRVSSASANDYIYTGIELYNDCKKLDSTQYKDAMNSKNCLTYVEGYLAGSSLSLFMTNGVLKKLSITNIAIPDMHCLPSNATLEQIIMVFNKYAIDHPNELNKTAHIVILAALSNAFCKLEAKK